MKGGEAIRGEGEFDCAAPDLNERSVCEQEPGVELK